MTEPTPKRRFANDGSYESIERQLKGLALKFFGRVMAIGIAMSLEDVEQELSIAYVKAKAAWKPDGGARFTTYFQTVACRHFNACILKEETERAHLGMGSVSALTDKWGMGDDEAEDALEHSAEQEDSREDSMIRLEEMRERIAKLSPDARRLVAMLLRAEGTCTDVTLKTLCAGMQIEGPRLKAVKAELNANFGVTWR